MSYYQPLYGGIGALNGNPTGVLSRGAGLAEQIAPFIPRDPLLGGSLSIGRTGLAALPSAAPSLASQAAGAATRMAPDLGMANQMGRAVGGAGSWFRPNVGLMGAAGRIGLGATAGQIGSGLIDMTDVGGQNSNWEQGLQGAAMGAGVGAAVGNLIPIPGVGAGIGAAVGGLAGGAIGVLGNMFGGGGGGESKDAETTPVQILGNAINTAGLNPQATEEILTTYETMVALAEAAPEGEQRDLAMNNAYETAAQMVLSYMQQGEQAQAAATDTLALQAQAGQIFEPLAQDIETSGMLYANAMKGIRDTLPESYRAIADATTARELTSSQKLANAYRAQAQIQPMVQQLTQYQRDQQNYAAQMFSQAMAQQAAGQTSSGGASQQDVLAALQG